MGRNTAASPKADRPAAQPEASAFAPSWFAPPPPLPVPNEIESLSTTRLWGHLLAARLMVAAGLCGLQLTALLQGEHPTPWLLGLCLAYLVATAAVLRWSPPLPADSIWSLRWGLTLWLDLAVFGLLQTFQPGTFNFTPLFVLPVLLAAALGPLVLALGSAASATLILLFDALTSEVWHLGQTTLLQGAITGAGLFVVAVVAHQLAQRLGREQVQARLSQAQATVQSSVNQLIVKGLSEGVLVVDAAGHIWHANPAACQMLGAAQMGAPDTALRALPGWPPLMGWIDAVLRQQHDERCELSLPTPDGSTLRVLLRARLTPPGNEHETPRACVVFMEDLRDAEARARNEKLAAMGRVSAAVAHEIRNPLSAITQAAALLSEGTLSPMQQRLTQMIGQNARRLGRTVDDVLDVATLPAHLSGLSPYIELDAQVTSILSDWQMQHPAYASLHLHAGAPSVAVRFDPEHLRRVLVNLLDNARKYGTGAFELATQASGQLTLWNPGPPMPAAVANHLFEPFASSHSRSSGLGLYLSRELCARHGAQLSYQAQMRDRINGHCFSIQFLL